MRRVSGKKLPQIIAFSALVAPGSIALAHHSVAVFDISKNETISGTVTEFAWVNPHALIRIDVPNDQQPAQSKHYAIELSSPRTLSGYGWKFNSLRPGDRVTLLISPLRDGRPAGLLIEARLAGGTTLITGNPRPGAKLPR
jgi:hypothetical protein